MTTMNRSLRPVVLVAAAAFAMACGHDSPSQVPLRHVPVTARVASVERVTQAATLEVYGLVQPTQQATVSSRVTGPVVAIRVAAGARVDKGSPLLEIQPEASAGQVAQVQGALAQAQAGLALAERNHQRYVALHAERAASDLELDLSRCNSSRPGAPSSRPAARPVARRRGAEAVVRAPFPARVVHRWWRWATSPRRAVRW